MDIHAFLQCKPSCVFLNLGRGPIVVEKDLVEALEKEWISAAALDVFEIEPLPSDSPLMQYAEKYAGTPKADRLLMTPHVAWAPLETRQRLVTDVGKSIEAWLNGEKRSRVV